MTDASLPNRRRLDARERDWLQEVTEKARRDWAAVRRQGSPAEKAAREAAMQEGLKVAVNVPFHTAQASFEAMEAAAIVIEHGNPASITDGMVGVQMGFAGVRGGIWNVLVNLKDITDTTYRAELQARCAALLDQARTLLDRALAEGDRRLEAMLAK